MGVNHIEAGVLWHTHPSLDRRQEPRYWILTKQQSAREQTQVHKWNRIHTYTNAFTGKCTHIHTHICMHPHTHTLSSLTNGCWRQRWSSVTNKVSSQWQLPTGAVRHNQIGWLNLRRNLIRWYEKWQGALLTDRTFWLDYDISGTLWREVVVWPKSRLDNLPPQTLQCIKKMNRILENNGERWRDIPALLPYSCRLRLFCDWINERDKQHMGVVM